MIQNIICVALGGDLGAVCRYLCGFINAPFLGGFPIITLLINFIGAVIIGILAELAGNAVNLLNEKASLFLKVGFCGGFTTFSAFSLEMADLLENGNAVMAMAYGVLSVIICLIGVILGRISVRAFCIR